MTWCSWKYMEKTRSTTLSFLESSSLSCIELPERNVVGGGLRAGQRATLVFMEPGPTSAPALLVLVLKGWVVCVCFRGLSTCTQVFHEKNCIKNESNSTYTWLIFGNDLNYVQQDMRAVRCCQATRRRLLFTLRLSDTLANQQPEEIRKGHTKRERALNNNRTMIHNEYNARKCRLKDIKRDWMYVRAKTGPAEGALAPRWQR